MGKSNLTMKLFNIFLLVAGIAAQDAAATEERGKAGSAIDPEEKAPRDCGGFRVQDKGKLVFKCKQKRREPRNATDNESITKVCKVSCGKRNGRTQGTPRKIFCKNNGNGGQWGSRAKQNFVKYNTKQFGCKN